MTLLDIIQIIFIAIVVVVSIGGIIYVLKNEVKSDDK